LIINILSADVWGPYSNRGELIVRGKKRNLIKKRKNTDPNQAFVLQYPLLFILIYVEKDQEN